MISVELCACSGANIDWRWHCVHT